MAFANVVFGLPVDGSFDYSVSPELEGRLRKGMRVEAPFRADRLIGYVTGISKKSRVPVVKPILRLIDENPLLSENMLKLTNEVAQYYGCSWGEAIHTALPQGIRNAKTGLELSIIPERLINPETPQAKLIHDDDRLSRWNIYLREIRDTLAVNKSVLFLNTDSQELSRTEKIIRERLEVCADIMHRDRGIRQSASDWLRARNQQAKIVLGVLSAIFAPLENLGLIIIDEEESLRFKNDQMPHYHCREVAFMRSRIQNSKIILAGIAPSLESVLLAKKGRIQYICLPKKERGVNIQIVDMRRIPKIYKNKDMLISESLQNAILQALEAKAKALLFLNRKGFATFAHCRNCGFVLRCARCSVNLAYHFKENRLKCHYCNYSEDVPLICPECNSGYIRYSGKGGEKIESELTRLYPAAKIVKADTLKDTQDNSADIFIATQSALKTASGKFYLSGIISCDDSLNRVDLRSAEKTFAILKWLLNLTVKSLVIQTYIPKHDCFKALVNNDDNIFYAPELAVRRHLGFPPFWNFISVKVRAKNETSAQDKAKLFFEKLLRENKNKSIIILNVGPAQPAKLRDNFYWQILLKSKEPKKAVKFIKGCLKGLTHSGVIVTLDVDPL